MAFETFPGSGPYSPESLTTDLNTNFGKTIEVALAAVADGEFLVYDGSSSVWINRTSSEAGIASAIGDLSDVTIASVANGEFLIYNTSSASWINATAAEAGIPVDLEDLGNVSVSSIVDGDVLTWNASSSSWINSPSAGGGGSTTLAALTDTTITTPTLGESLVYNGSAWVNLERSRNYIINGDMAVAQRGTSTTGITGAATDVFVTDRWALNANNAGTWTYTQDTDIPTGQGFVTSTKLTATAADATLAADDYVLFRQNIIGRELQDLKKGTASAENMYMSFWVKSDTTGTYIVELNDVNNSRSVSTAYTIGVADTWEKKTLLISGDTTGTFANDNTNGLQVIMWLAAGTTFSSGTLATAWGAQTAANRAVGQVNLAGTINNYISITGVQLETGGYTNYKFESYSENLGKCHEYCQVYPSISPLGTGYAESANSIVVQINTLKPLISNTYTATETGMTARYDAGLTTAMSVAAGAFIKGLHSMAYQAQVDSGTPFTVGRGVFLYATSDFTVDAEP